MIGGTVRQSGEQGMPDRTIDSILAAVDLAAAPNEDQTLRSDPAAASVATCLPVIEPLCLVRPDLPVSFGNMERVRIPNDATYSPVALTDLAIAAPLLSRLVLGATLPGRLVQAAALAVYAGSAARDWLERLGVRKIDFLREFGADARHLEEMPASIREAEITVLAERLNDSYTPDRIALRELAPIVDAHLTNYIAAITGQRVETSTEVRSISLVQFIFPFALGAADMLSGDISIFHDAGVFQPHVVAHEFCHRKGYWGELEAQALAYLALSSSGEAVLVQSALCERLHRNLRVLVGDDEAAFDSRVRSLGLRNELTTQFLSLRPQLGPLARSTAETMRALYDLRMRLTGQNGISDYDVGFTNFLYSFESSGTARQRPSGSGTLR